jgi:hypothetical protein
MISIQGVVESILKKDAEAYASMKRGIINFSQYAHSIHGQVEDKCKKEVRHGSIVIALTRIAETKRDGLMKSYAPRVKIRNITTKLPVTEIVFDKTPNTLALLPELFKKVTASVEDFFVMTLSTQEITIVCSDALLVKVEKVFKEKPKMKQRDLAAIGLSFSEEYYKIPNITFSLIREIALREINLAETVSSYTEVVFICHQKDLGQILEAFSIQKSK